MITRKLKSVLGATRKLSRDNSAVVTVEMAFTAPILLGMGLMGTETAHFAISHMQISQVAMQVADNASRIGEHDVLVQRKVYEDDINGALVGAEKLGDTFDIYENGRVIISSLQQNADGGQWIAWQRCRGALQRDSSYGVEGAGETGTDFPGMGDSGSEITASSGTAVIFVEVFFEYEPITPFEFYAETELNYTAAFNVRDSRDLTQVYQTNPASPVASCGVYLADRPA